METARFLAMATAFMLGGCFLTPDTASLQAISPTRPAGPSCSACHPYALKDWNHYVHLIYNRGIYVKQANGFVTCLDCHRTALQSTTGFLLDSLYQDADGVIRSSVDFQGSFPAMPGVLIRIDTLEQHHPVPLNDKVLGVQELREWVTGLAHMNGTVDVVFDATISDTARFQGARAEFNPVLETCSAISCHSKDGQYRFEACSKNLPGLAGEGLTHQCEELL